MFHHKFLQNCLLMILAINLFKTRGGFIVCGGLTPSFLTNYYKKYPKLSEKVQDVIKA